MIKDINEKKYNEFKKKKIFRLLYIFLALFVVITEILVLLGNINVVWGIVSFALLYIMKKILIK